MKRRIFKLAPFLLLGAIFNVAVAWILLSLTALTVEPKQASSQSLRDWSDVISSSRLTTSAFPIVIREFERRGLGVAQQIETAAQCDPYCGDQLPLGAYGVVRAGWPCFALQGSLCDDLRGQTRFRILCRPLSKPIVRLDSRFEWRELPYGLNPAGFAINTIFYAALLWLPFAALGRLRRRRRIKRGLCPACAYPVGDSAVCTECGKAVKG